MDENLNYKSYILLSKKKLLISIYSDLDKKIYENEVPFKKHLNFQEVLNQLDHFLDENIFNIEKKIKSFIKKINIILDLNIFFLIDISIKDINHDDYININNMNYLLYEAKDYCKKTIGDRKIVHMIISNYQIDDQNYSHLPKNVKGKNFSIDLNFICISYDLIKNLENILKKYQISAVKMISFDYISKFFKNDEKDIFLLTKEILNGYNPNEITIVNKTPKKEGFFEKFFNFFS